MASAASLIKLFHHRWNVPLLASLHQLGGAKFITLLNRHQMSRDSLSRTLEVLMQHGWIMRNPGYGHPLRPEYIFTPAGEKLGPLCAQLMKGFETLGLKDVGLNKWSMPVVYSLCQGHHRFSELKNATPGITPRALTQTLEQLEQACLIQRNAISAIATRSRYDLMTKNCPLCAALEQLVQALAEATTMEQP